MIFAFGKPDIKKMEKEKNISGLIEALNSNQIQVRREAAFSLGKVGDVNVITFLLSALNDKDQYVRRQAVDALGNIGDISVLDKLSEILQDPSTIVRQGALEAIKLIKERIDY